MEISALKTSRSEQPKKFEDKELEALLEEDQSHARGTCRIIGDNSTSRFCTIESHGNNSKTRKLSAYELKPRDVERRFFTCEQLIQRQQRKGFLHRIVTGDEKWIFYDNLKKKIYYAKPGQSLLSTSISTSRPNIHGSKIMHSVSGGTKRVLFTMSC